MKTKKFEKLRGFYYFHWIQNGEKFTQKKEKKKKNIKII